MNAMHVGYTRYDYKDAQCNRERAAAVERELSSYEVEARRLVDGSIHEKLFDDNQAHDQLSDRDAMNARTEVSGPIMDDSNDFEQYQTAGRMTIKGLRNQLRTRCQSRRIQL